MVCRDGEHEYRILNKTIKHSNSLGENYDIEEVRSLYCEKCGNIKKVEQ